MPIELNSQPSLKSTSLESEVSDLKVGAKWLSGASLSSLRELVDACSLGVVRNANEWVRVACQAKRIAAEQPIAAEEILAGPATVLRYLRLLSKVLQDAEKHGSPILPGKPHTNSQGRECIPVLPVRSLFDGLTFMGLEAEIWRQKDSNPDELFTSTWKASDNAKGNVAGVLGAGNVSSIPATDMLYKIFHNRESVLLKLNPVNDYLAPIFMDAFRPLVEAKLLRIVCGGIEVGDAIVKHESIGSLHLTGSHLTHDAILWGSDPQERATRKRENRPIVTKSVTSELGNVTPWIIVPGLYTDKQLRNQAEHVVAGIVNNASFNCLATKMIVTSRGWAQRVAFLDLIDAFFRKIPPRFAYYPGAHQRFERATGRPCPEASDGTLPWTLIRDTNPNESPHLFDEESFVCVCAETQLSENAPETFLESAVDFVNDRIFGTLCATITLPSGFRQRQATAVDRALAKLRYGAVCINQWPGVAYGIMTPPWGGYPGATIAEPLSGIGHVHNTFCVSDIDKTVLWGPLCNFPKPVWFPTHRTANQVAWDLLGVYDDPSILRLPKLFFHALRG